MIRKWLFILNRSYRQLRQPELVLHSDGACTIFRTQLRERTSHNVRGGYCTFCTALPLDLHYLELRTTLDQSQPAERCNIPTQFISRNSLHISLNYKLSPPPAPSTMPRISHMHRKLVTTTLSARAMTTIYPNQQGINSPKDKASRPLHHLSSTSLRFNPPTITRDVLARVIPHDPPRMILAEFKFSRPPSIRRERISILSVSTRCALIIGHE